MNVKGPFDNNNNKKLEMVGKHFQFFWEVGKKKEVQKKNV